MAKRKYSYEFIKKFIESAEYVLLLKECEYKNVRTKLKVQCSKGHIYTTSWGHFFHRGHRCRLCRRLTIEYVKSSFSLSGYELLEDTYFNSTVKMRYRCPHGHVHSMAWRNWKQGCRCPDCIRTSFETVVSAFSEKGYIVISNINEYTHSKFKFKFICPTGHISSMSWYNFRSGNNCGKCAHNARKTIEEVRDYFKLHGYRLLSTEYIDEHSLLFFECPNGHEHTITWSNFKRGSRCAICARGNVSKISQEWLDSLCVPTLKREYYIKNLKLRVDGYDPFTNTVYEFLGDYWHGNPKIYSPEKINLTVKKSYGQLYKEWLNKKEILCNSGFKLVYIWEADFKSLQIHKV